MTLLRALLALAALMVALAVPAAVSADDDDDEPKSRAKAATVVAIAHDHAVVRGTVLPDKHGATWWFEYGPHLADVRVTPKQTTAVKTAHEVKATLGGLTADTTYYFRLVAEVGGKSSASAIRSFTTAAVPPPAAPPEPEPSPAPAEEPAAAPTADDFEPELGETVVAAPADGEVKVRVPGSDKFVALGAADAVPLGSVVDATGGSVQIAAGVDAAGRIQTGTFGGSRFLVRQAPNGYVNLHLRGGDFRGCAPARDARTLSAAAAAAKKKRRVRDLWGSDKGGRFRTHGRDSVATVRGTEWSMTDRCDGTLTKVSEGAVDVRVRRTGKVVRVRAGERHLARHVR